MKNFRIVKSTYYNKYGHLGKLSYYIEERQKFFWGLVSRWFPILEHGPDWEDIHYFNTKEEAEEFIHKTLKQKTPRHEWINEIVGLY